MFHLKKRIYRQELSRAYKELNTHYSILSNPDMRGDKEYVDKFCYFDGTNNIPIHEFINDNFKELSEYLDQTKINKYEQYLNDEKNKDFHDNYINNLGKEEFEGRFDAVMRHIATNI